MPNARTLIPGGKYGKLTLLYEVSEDRKRWALFRCDCGSIKRAYPYHVRDGNIVSCGCRRRRPSDYSGYVWKKPEEYGVWSAMKDRCLNPKSKAFPDYGGRGIKVFDGWVSSFSDFLKHIGNRPSKKHSIERIDVNGNYEPGNVRWATRIEQARNTRSNHKVEFRGETLCLSEWCDRYNLRVQTLKDRLDAGWPVETALTLPLQPSNHKKISHRGGLRFPEILKGKNDGQRDS